ncbi:hypothetical protein K505DRAFT_340908 [Melanomma pulvis-pyrius CBS 109.77]|uniref:Uncharacterized protein n=1 Tax=Melanomma pulvis-pyrius CBS 109.77 TaxID=1314802 RepID=A0A6A6X117_9PLEO|nr:hypothetical protein K505DRAFT_340908 [Melanomma pulvis-pyrius CBS 109.77]
MPRTVTWHMKSDEVQAIAGHTTHQFRRFYKYCHMEAKAFVDRNPGCRRWSRDVPEYCQIAILDSVNARLADMGAPQVTEDVLKWRIARSINDLAIKAAKEKKVGGVPYQLGAIYVSFDTDAPSNGGGAQAYGGVDPYSGGPYDGTPYGGGGADGGIGYGGDVVYGSGIYGYGGGAAPALDPAPAPQQNPSTRWFDPIRDV